MKTKGIIRCRSDPLEWRNGRPVEELEVATRIVDRVMFVVAMLLVPIWGPLFLLGCFFEWIAKRGFRR